MESLELSPLMRNDLVIPELTRRVNVNLAELASLLSVVITPITWNPLRMDSITGMHDLITEYNSRMALLCDAASIDHVPVTLNAYALDLETTLSLMAAQDEVLDTLSSGSVSEWVPAGAKIHIDLVGGSPQGRAWVDGVGEVAIDTLLGADPNTGDTENGFGESSYDPENLTSDGYTTGLFAFIGMARTKIFAGCTARVALLDHENTSVTMVFQSADFGDAIQVGVDPGAGIVYGNSFGGDLDFSIPDAVNMGDDVANCVAFTIENPRFEIAANGSDVAVEEITNDDWPNDNPLVAAGINLGNATCQSITLYDALPSTAGLSDLSVAP